MGLLDVLTGRRKLKGPAPDRLFALSTAYVTLAASHDVTAAGAAGIVFQPLATGDFKAIADEVEQLVRATGGDLGARIERSDDSYGFRWLIVRDEALEDLVVAVNTVSGALETGGYGERLLCAVFAFRSPSDPQIYLIYNFKRGTWYPFVPAAGEQARSNERELRLKAQIGNELPVEPELERWFPLWGIPF